MRLFHSISSALVISLTLLGCAGALRESEEEREREHARERAKTAIEPFELVVELTAEGAKLESRAGTKWQTVTWSCAEGEPCSFYLGVDGISGAASNITAEGFCFEVEKTASGAKLEAIRRVAWKELSYDCGAATPCRFVVTESGVHGE